MKIRSGFVSNSSSSSFVIFKDGLSCKQRDAILNHSEVVNIGLAWEVDDSNPDFITVRTDMDNFNMQEYIRQNRIWNFKGPFEYLPSEYW
jgi:hypothetical protein